MSICDSSSPASRRRYLCLIAFLAVAAGAAIAAAQTPREHPYYGRTNTFGILAAYSADSSHMLLGSADNRRLLSFGGVYGRKLLLNRVVNWQYSAEVLPVALESDPVVVDKVSWTSPTTQTETGTFIQAAPCVAYSGTFSGTDPVTGTTYSYNYSFSCSRRWTVGEAISPIGMQWNFMPHHKLQPFFVGHGGYMYSTQPIPVATAGSFNFTFDLGAGLELYRSRTQSVRAEFRYHHISNHDTAIDNPGIDNGLVQVTYCFGR